MHNNVSSVSSPLDVAATHHKINVDILTTSAFLRCLPNVGEVVLDTMPQSIISVLAMAAGARIAYLANYTLCQKHGLDYVEASKAAGVQSLCFSTTERDVFITPRVEAGFERLATNAERIKLRIPDNYLNGRANISWVSLSELTLPLLDGMNKSVQKHRPLISGKVSNCSVESIILWCEKYGYFPLTNLLEPLNATSASGYCWLVPNNTLLKSVRALLAADNEVAEFSYSLPKFAQQFWPELTESSDKLAKQTKDYITHARRWYYLDKLVNIGMYPIETDGTNYWRWVGNKGVRLFIPLRAIGFYTVKFNVFSVVDGMERVGLKCFLNGVFKKDLDASAGSEIAINHFTESEGELVELFIVPQTSVQVFDRALSVSISELAVYWEGEVL